MAKRNVHHNHINIKDLLRTKSNKNDHGDYVKDLLILSEPPIHFKCDKHGQCDEDFRKFSKISKKADLEWKNKRMPVGHSKRFQIVDNRSKKKPKMDTPDRNSEEDDNDKKRPLPIFNKKKYAAVTGSASASEESESGSIERQRESRGEDSESGEQSDSKQSGSEEQSGSGEASGSQANSGSGEQSGSGEVKENSSSSSESWEVEEELYESQSKSVEESKGRKQHTTKLNQNEEPSSESNSEVEEPSKEVSKEKKKYKNHSKKRRKTASESRETGDDKNRKRFATDDIILQGNKMYSRTDKLEKKHNATQRPKRRRLQQFMPKRYHWDESEIHDLGYFWYNGPRGIYPAPKSLSVAKK
ncbi:protein FAM133-like [Spodoptera litura]|uniref:Protein FAM133-like n=1 Tax=Spodoptera litura TaxID=69820 RepID=A0A9J7EL76_SPOLT|nr:protein FAM133-like [Spodoptera litura]